MPDTAVATPRRRGDGGAPGRTLRLHLAAVLLFVAGYVVVAYLSAPAHQPDRYFEEGQAVDVMSALFLVMAGTFAWACFLLSGHADSVRRAFWLLLAVGFLFVALDELLEIHESLDQWVLRAWLGWPPLFRNWNDVIVLSYGLAGGAFLVAFRHEVRRHPGVVPMLVLGALCYALHTGIDTLIAESARKTVVEESAKLAATAFFALAMLAGFLSVARSARNRPGAAADPH